MTLIEPTTTARPDPATVDADAWAAVRDKSKKMGRWAAKAVELATEDAGRNRPGPVTRWRGRRLAARAEAIDAARRLHSVPQANGRVVDRTQPTTPTAGRLRLIPPVAALGTAFVLQVLVMTDVVGGKAAAALTRSDLQALADRTWIGYLAGALLGVAVASCAEGGAAYLMDLYDKHLMARDSVGVLRLAMVGYVAASAGVIHWWTGQHHFPSLIAWVLAGMTGSSLFLWSRGSRWKHRSAMRSAGQLDPAMARLPLAAKLLHPYRWAVTLYLTSWEPVSTPDEARARFGEWSAQRAATKKACTTVKEHGPWSPRDKLRRRAIRVRWIRPTSSAPDTSRQGSDHGPTAIADAAMIRRQYGVTPPGRNELWRTHGGHKERWTKALRAYADQADQSAA